MPQTRFTKDHEYARVDGDVATIGISNYAQEQLGDVVYVELPEVGRQLKKGEDAAVVESVKAASDVYAPLSGEVIEANAALASNPAAVNQEAEGGGWFFKIRISDTGELADLMGEDDYRTYTQGL
jgi:glycine cleavage system H protein